MTLKFLIAGSSSYIIYSLLLIIGIEFLRIEEILNNAISFGITFFYSFYLAKNWVFKATGKIYKMFNKYLIVALINYFINITGFGIIIYFYDIHYLLVQFIMMALVTIFSFFIQKLWVFAKD